MKDQLHAPKITPKKSAFHARTYLRTPMGQQSVGRYSATRSPHLINDSYSMMGENEGFIYGTNIEAQKVINGLERFIFQFEVSKIEGEDHVIEKHYYNKLQDIDLLQSRMFEVEGVHLKEFDSDLYFQFIYFPAEMITYFDFVLKSLYDKFFVQPETNEETRKIKESRGESIMISLKHLDDLTPIRSITPKHINRLISFRGITIRTSDIYPEMKAAHFRCTTPRCLTELEVNLENAKVVEPTLCPRCHLKNSFQIIHNLCEFTDKQFVKFQELPDFVPEGETPASLTILCYDGNVDGIRPGDRVEVVGIVRAQGVKVQKSQSTLKSVFNTYIDLISFTILEENKYKANSSKTVFNDDEKIQFSKMANKASILNDLIKSFAPSIFGNEDVKKGILAQLFGGSQKDFTFNGRARFRSDINICLVGDPSTAKSQMLQQVFKIAPRGIYTSGRGSSAVGLTANVRRDPETKQFVLESGALVLSDSGICCIDQFDKMDDNSRIILLEAMEQQTISIAKAGIVCQLNSRTAILAAANPVNSKYNPRKSVVENINLSPALLSRFDLIYIMLDLPNEIADKKMAAHILDIYSAKQKHTINQGTYSKKVFSRYITFAREYVHPVLSEGAANKLAEAYQDMRKLGNNKKTITATPRQLQSLIRISESFAKMRLSNDVSESDVDQAIDLVKTAIIQSATDPSTGLIDMDIITTGKTSASRQRVQVIMEKAKEIIKSNITLYMKSTALESLLAEVEKHMGSDHQKILMSDFLEAMKLLQSEDLVTIFGQNKHSLQFKLQKDLGDA